MPCASFVLSNLCGFLPSSTRSSHEVESSHRPRGALVPGRSRLGQHHRDAAEVGTDARGRPGQAAAAVEPGLWRRVGRRHPAARRRQCPAEDGGAITRRQEGRVHRCCDLQARQRDAADGRGGRQG